MKTTLLLIIYCLYLTPLVAGDNAETLKILNTIDDMWRLNSSKGVFVLQVKTAQYTRTMKMEFWTKGEDFSLTKILEPLKERGTATLKIKNEIYNYLPKIDRTIKIGTSVMSNSWMGSHLSNDDIVKNSRFTRDYDAHIDEEKRSADETLYKISLKPKKGIAIVWGKVVVNLIQSNDGKTIIPTEQLYLDEKMQAVRKITFSDIKPVAGRKIPFKIRVEPYNSPGEFTELIYQKIEFDIPLSDEVFSVNNIKVRG